MYFGALFGEYYFIWYSARAWNTLNIEYSATVEQVLYLNNNHARDEQYKRMQSSCTHLLERPDDDKGLSKRM
jgi:hypothetical protein